MNEVSPAAMIEIHHSVGAAIGRPLGTASRYHLPRTRNARPYDQTP